MRSFAIGLVVVALTAFVAFVWITPKIGFVASPEPRHALEGLKVTVASAHGWDVITGRQTLDALQDETGSCGDPYLVMPELTHAGHTRVTLEVPPRPDQKLVITAVRLRVNATTPSRSVKYVYHCSGPAGAPATRVRVDAGGQTSYPVDGPFPQQVTEQGYRQDIEVEVHGEKAAEWRVEIDYTLDGVAETTTPTFQGLVTEPVPADADGHQVWCDQQWRPGEHC